jgi:preprotein translocase subunit SecD
MPRGKLPRILLAAGAIAVVLVVVAGFLSVTGAFQQNPDTLLRQQGGYRFTLQASCPPSLPGCDVSALLSATSDTLTHRIADALQITSAQVRRQGDTQLVVYLPGLTDPTGASDLLSTRGVFEIIDTGGQQLASGASVAGETCTSGCDANHFQIIFDGSEIDPNSVAAQLDPNSGQPILTFAFAGTARDRFAQYTQSHIGEYLTMVLDDTVLNASVIESAITSSGEITGFTSVADAQRLAAYLKDGALPLAITVTAVVHIVPGSALG